MLDLFGARGSHAVANSWTDQNYWCGDGHYVSSFLSGQGMATLPPYVAGSPSYMVCGPTVYRAPRPFIRRECQVFGVLDQGPKLCSRMDRSKMVAWMSREGS